jgi:hypothetical protein
MADLKERYGFDRWRGRDGRRLIRDLLPDLTAADLELESRERIIGEDRGHIDLYRRPARPVRVAVTIVSHPTAQDAHEALLHVLARVMAPQLPSCEEQGLNVGDACFCSLGERLEKVFFVRANVLVRVENAGAERIDLRRVCALIDEQLQRAQDVAPA